MASLGLTGGYLFKLISRKPLGQRPNIELDHTRILISLNPSDREPQEQFLGLDPRHVRDRPISQFASNLLVIVNQLVELDVTGAEEIDLKVSIFRESVGLDVVWEDTLWETIL